MNMPIHKPERPFFSAGPCAKYPDYDVKKLSQALVGRSHRADVSKDRLSQAIRLTREVLKIPDDYLVGIVPGSASGAMEALLWPLLGPRPVECVVTDVFTALWENDIFNELKLKGQVHKAPFGENPDVSGLDPCSDWVFGWNGSTGGVCFPHGEWISDRREGLTLCDATSAAFAYDLPWHKLDATAFSWQKGLGSEGAHGMIVLGPRAVERLIMHKPAWPIPRVLRLVREGNLIEGIFRGETINTPSMLAVEDYVQALLWAQSVGGLPGLLKRVDQNFEILKSWVEQHDRISFVTQSLAVCSRTTPCLSVRGFEAVDYQNLYQRVAAQGAGFDFLNHKLTQPSLRIWTGATVDREDLRRLTLWLDWALD